MRNSRRINARDPAAFPSLWWRGCRVLLLPLTLAYFSAGAAGSPAARCLAGLEGLAPEQRVIPSARCPELVASLGAGSEGGLVSPGDAAVPVEALRSLAGSLAPATVNRVHVDPGQVSRIVDETHASPIPGWLAWLRDWLDRQEPEANPDMVWLKGLSDWISDNGDWLLLLFEGALAVLVLVLLIWIIAGLRWPRLRWPGLRRGRGVPAPSRAEAGDPRPGRLEDIAAMAEADQAPAVLAWLVREWERSARLPGATRMTDGQIMHWLGRQSATAAGSFRELARVAEAALYGGRVPDAAHRQRCFEIAGALAPAPGRRP